MEALPLLTVKDLGKFEVNLIREHPLWFLFANEDQRLIGRCYAWSKVPGDMQDMAFLSTESLLDLRRVQQNWRIALQRLFPLIHTNYEWLGNEIQKHGGHGHMHLIPRYTRPFWFMEEECVDVNFSANAGTRHDKYVDGLPLRKRQLPPKKMRELIKQIQANLPPF